MADNPLISDNLRTTTERIIQATTGAQVFANSGSDNGFSIGPGDSNDFFQLTVSRSSNVVVKLQPQGGDLSLAVLDSAGNPISTRSNDNNTDGLADAIVSNPNTPLQPGQTYYIQVSGTSTTDINYSLSVETNPTSRSDILWQNVVAPGANGIWRMNGTQPVGFDFSVFVDPVWRLAGVGDFNGDNAADYLWHEPIFGQAYIWLMDGSGTTATEAVPLGIVGGNWYVGGIGDFSGDGKSDILWVDSNTGYAGVWAMDGVVPFRFDPVDYIPDPNWVISAVADFNKDGKLDLFYRNYTTGENSIWLMNGTSFFQSSDIFPVAASWDMNATGDFNGDGNQDLLWHDRTSGLIYTWFMNGTEVITGTEIGVVNSAIYQIAGVLGSALPVDLAGNSPTTAFNIGTLNATARYNDVIGSSDNQDWYSFNLEFGSKIGLTATGTGLSNLANFDILSSNGTVIASAVTTGADEKKLTNLTLDPGTYYVRAAATGSNNANYDLSIVLEERIGSNLLFPPSPTVTFKQNGTVVTSPIRLTNPVTIDMDYQMTYIGSTVSQFKVAFYLSKDNVLDANDLRFDLNGDSQRNAADVATITGAAPNTVINRTQQLTLPRYDDPFWSNRPANDTTAYNIIIQLDPPDTAPQGDIREIDPVTRVEAENDNTFAAPIQIERFLPDLIPVNFDVTQTIAARGGRLDLSGLVRNAGIAPSDFEISGTRFEIRFYLSRDNVFDATDRLLPTSPSPIRLNPLGVGAEASIGSGVFATLPGNGDSYYSQPQPGNSYFVIMRVDSGASVREFSPDGELNNFAFDTIVIG